MTADTLPKEYAYVLYGMGVKGQARIYYSDSMPISRREIAAELRALATWIETGIGR